MLNTRLVCFAGLLLTSLSAAAVPITFTGQTTASGQTGNSFSAGVIQSPTGFTDRLVSVTFEGDTDDIGFNGAAYYLTTGSSSVTIDGVGTFTGLTRHSSPFLPFGAISVPSFGGSFAFGCVGCNSLMRSADGSPPSNAGYDLSTAFGPLSVATEWNFAGTYATAQGVFIRLGAPTTPQSLEISTVLAPNPEPSSVALAALGLGVIAWRRRRADPAPSAPATQS